MGENDINNLTQKINLIGDKVSILSVQVTEVYQLLVGEHNGLGEKPGLVAICRTHREKYKLAEQRLTDLEKVVADLNGTKSNIKFSWLVITVLVVIVWELFKTFYKA